MRGATSEPDNKSYAYADGDPIDNSDPLGLDVYICTRPAKIAAGLVNHYWVVTSSVSAGMGANPNVAPGAQYEGYGMPVQIIDHSKDTPTSCVKQNNVNEQCVNSKLKLGTPLGRFIPPINQCSNLAFGVVNSCRTGPQIPPNK